jgi:hypothetical protein
LGARQAASLPVAELEAPPDPDPPPWPKPGVANAATLKATSPARTIFDVTLISCRLTNCETDLRPARPHPSVNSPSGAGSA